MIIGTFRYGRVDRVPGRFYVATQFLHFCYLPIVPLQSYVIQQEELESFQGVPIPMSLKSVFLTWARAIMLLYVLTTSWAMWQGNAPESQLVWTIGTAVAVVASWFYVPRATFTRAVQLGLAMGVAPSDIAKQYKREAPDTETLSRLESELKPLTADGKPGVGSAGRFFGGLAIFAPGAWLTYYGFYEILESGRKGYGASFVFALVMLAGLSLSIFGLNFWTKLPRKTRNILFLVALVLAVLVAGLGPTMSHWWLKRSL